jgi:hypothetical protein
MKKAEIKGLGGWVVLALVVLAMSGCAGKKKLITTHGIYAARIGQDMPEWGIEAVKGIPAQDTVFAEGDFEWRVTRLDFKKGAVFVEEDFYQSGQVSRIRVETPELRLRNGMRVGMSVADLAKLKQHWYISPIPAYGLWNFYSREYPRVNFVVDDPQKMQETGGNVDWETLKIGDFNSEAPIRIIVVY